MVYFLSAYTSIVFCASYSVQSLAWFVCFVVTVFFDLVLFEFLTELRIAMVYACRKSSEAGASVGEFLNRMKNIKSLR